jgi:hypothetical protein
MSAKKPANTTYNEAPDWVRELCIEHVPTTGWLDGGLEVAAVEMVRLIGVRGEETARLGLRRMVDEGTLGTWLAQRRARVAA